MTISNAVRTAGPYTGNGVTTVFPFGFKVFLASDVVAVRSDGTTQTTLVLNTDYTVSLNADQDSIPGGSITTIGMPLSSSYTLTLTSNVAQLQGASLQNQGGFYPKVIENALDRAVILIQQLSSIVNRTLRFPLSDTGTNTELPTKANRINKLLSFDANGNPVAVAPSDQSAASVSIQLANFIAGLATTSGSSQVGVDFSLNYVANTIGWGVQTAGNSFNFLRLIPVSEWLAILNGTSAFDVTALLTSALSNYKDVFVPAGVYSVNPDIGVLLVGSCRLRGACQNQTIFAAVAQGATTAELAAYTKGSVFKRTFTPGVPNARVDTVHLSDFAVVLNHPTGSVTTTEIQIGLDMRNIGRSQIDRVWVGNIPPLGGRMVKADPGAYGSQGYGMVFGTMSSGDVAYCGGEVHRVTNCSVFSCFKNIVIDEATLSPLSGCHAVNITGCDVQGGHSLIAQEQQYTAGCMFSGNTVQNVVRQPGNASATYVYRIAGYDNDIEPGYIEAGVTDYLLRLDSASADNRIHLTHYSATTIGIAAFSDAGRRNEIGRRIDTGTNPGGIDSKGAPIVMYDRAYQEMTIVAHWNGSAMVVDDGFGLTVTRPTAAGDYLFTFAIPLVSTSSNGYTLDVSYDTNASGHGGTHAVISHNANNVRIQFYAQNGGTSTAIDPRFVFLRVKLIP